MGGFLKQSTASQARALGPFIDDTDFKTTKTALTIANTDIKLVINGAASANKNSGGGTHRVNGVYGVTFDATDTATVGEMQVSVVVSGALPMFDKFFVVEEVIYDKLFAASALGYIANAPVNVAQFGGSNGTFASGRPEINLTHIAAAAVSTSTAQLGVNLVNAAGTAWASGAITAASIAADAITAAKIADNALDRASFAADTGLQSIRSNTATAGAASTITLDASASAVNSYYLGTSILLTGGTGAGQFRIITAYVGATKVATVNRAWATNPDNTTTFAIFPAADTSADIADAVWDELQSGHTTVGTFGKYLDATVSGVSTSGITVADIADAVWDEALSGHTTSGSSGERVGRLPNAVAGAANGLFIAGTNAATAITTGLTTNFIGSLTGSVASVTGAVGSVTGNVGGNVTGSVGSLASQAKADVNAEVVDALTIDTYAQPSAVPAATSSIKDKLNWLYTLGRNKVTETSSTQLVRNDADSATIGTSTVSDDTVTFIRGQFS